MRLTIVAVMLAALTAVAPGAARADDDPPSLATARVLLPDARDARDASARCPDIACLLRAAYARDPAAAELALALYRDHGHVAGVGVPEVMDGGFRGAIRLLPQLPTGVHRKHLAWLAAAAVDLDAVFAARDAPAPRFRWRGLALRFVRSPGKRTPSAYASAAGITYNVAGSLLTSAAGVRETLVHELFHVNDGDWSPRALGAIYDAIVARCGTRTRCLAPYAPNTTKVRATGTYYAFQPNNGSGVREYAAELCVRYWREQHEMRERGALTRPAWKCGPPENARAWRAFVDHFFAGRDLTPACQTLK